MRLLLRKIGFVSFFGACAIATAQPRPGSTIPAFSLPDQHGNLTTLKKISGSNGAMLVFHRSADW
jgi:hypothetical protein